MAKDYILFLHGVNVREFPDTLDDPNFPVFANSLFELIQHALYDNTLLVNYRRQIWYHISQNALK